MNNRQNGRRRGRGGVRPQNGAPRPEGGNRIDNRARGNAAQLHEKYKSLARDAQMQGDRVLTEYYFQFADHYFRVLAESRPRGEEGQPQARRFQNDDRFDAQDDFQDGFEGSEGYSDEGFSPSGNGAGNGGGNGSTQQPQRNEPRNNQPRNNEPRNNERNEPRQEMRDPRAEPRNERPESRYEARGERYEPREQRPEPRDPEPELAFAGGQASDPPQGDQPETLRDEEAPRRRRGRPRREDAPAQISRSDDGDRGGGERIDIASLPPAVRADPAPAPEPATTDEPAPPRRRVRRPRETAETSAEV